MSFSMERSPLPCGDRNVGGTLASLLQLRTSTRCNRSNRRALMKTSDRENKNRNTEPSSPGRRTFVKGIGAIGAGVTAFPLLSNTVEAQASAAPDNGIPSGSSRAEVALQVPLVFQGDKIDWHGFDRYDFVMDIHTLAITPFKAPPDERAGNIG